MDELFASAQQSRPQIDAQVQRDLDALFSTNALGFREIVLVIAIARMLNPAYTASTAFYAANPRPLFEGPIRQALRARGIPHGKSGPLNVAKATEGITAEWALRRRPRSVAERVVALVHHIESLSPQDLLAFSIVLHGMFLDEARRIQAMGVDIAPTAEIPFLFDTCQRLITESPDSGNTLQRIAGLLLRSYHEALQTGIQVAGVEDRASVTTTTSKKLGDLAEEQADGTVVCAYEVTTKPFNEARVVEAYDAVRDYDASAGSHTAEIVVVCLAGQQHDQSTGIRMAQGYLGVFVYQDLAFHFVEMLSWVSSQLTRMPAEARMAFYEELGAYIADPNTSERVKIVWRQIHASTPL